MMNKDEFLNDLRHALKGLPYEEVNKTLDYYSELIDDAVERFAEQLAAVKFAAGQLISEFPGIAQFQIKPANQDLKLFQGTQSGVLGDFQNRNEVIQRHVLHSQQNQDTDLQALLMRIDIAAFRLSLLRKQLHRSLFI